jgi:sugar porter (SP) family MFS transporter
LKEGVLASKDTGFVYVVAGIAALAGLLFGYDTGVISGAILFIQKDFNLSAEQEGLVVSGVLFGATFSSLFSGKLTDYFGRRLVILGISLLFVGGSIIAALANSVPALVAGRFILGLAIGIASFTAPLYISEVSPPDKRGGLVSLNQLAITVGILGSYLVDYIFSGQGQWQMMVGFGAVPGVILGIGMLVMPESPRWYTLKGRKSEARLVLARIRGSEDVEKELSEIESTLAEEEQGEWKELVLPSMRRLLLIGLGLAFFQQFTGINTVIYYAPTIFNLAGFESNSVSILATAGVGLVNVAMTIVGVCLLDKMGRRPLLLTGLVGMLVSLTTLSLGFMQASPGEHLKWIGVGSLVLYVASFAISLGPIFWLIIAEIYPLNVRGLAMGLATAMCWVSNLIVSYTFPILIKYAGPSLTFSLYAVITILAISFSYWLVPETKGLSLEEIEHGSRKAGKIGIDH